MSICIRRAGPADKAGIEYFIRRAYGKLASFKGPDRWQWQFVGNPFLFSKAIIVPVWIALDGDDIVGQIAVQAAEVRVAEQSHAAGWIVDVMILPAYRGRRLGHLLYAAVAEEVSILLMLTMAPATRRMAERGGAITLGATKQFSRWVRPNADDVRRYLVQRTQHRRRLGKAARWACSGLGLHKMLALLVGGLVQLHDWRRVHDKQELNIREVECFGPELDDLWNRVQGGYPAICPRNRRFLAWRFTECPALRYRIFLAYRDGDLVGYSVLRRTLAEELRQGIIVDLLADRQDHAAFRSLISHAITFFGHDLASLECATSVPEIEAVLGQSGFFRSRSLSPTISVADDSLRSTISGLRNDWFFSKADHDWDQVHLG